jgi:hypothetical protein
MEIIDTNTYASLNWNGTKTKLDVLSIDGRIVFHGDSSNVEGDDDYFVKISDPITLEHVLNILSMMEPQE